MEFLICTNKNGKQMAIAIERILSIEEAPIEEQKKDIRIAAIITVMLGVQTTGRMPVFEPIETLLAGLKNHGK